jgi:hypothetical protein
VVDLRYPQKVPEDASVTTDSIADGSITNDKLAEPVSVANGGTGKTTAAEALAALGGASLNGSSTVAFNASTINGVAPLTAAEKTQALVGSSTVNFSAASIDVAGAVGKTFTFAGIARNASFTIDVTLPPTAERGYEILMMIRHPGDVSVGGYHSIVHRAFSGAITNTEGIGAAFASVDIDATHKIRITLTHSVDTNYSGVVLVRRIG